jgi:3-oxoacyl-[acyl-carrier protein] reductase
MRLKGKVAIVTGAGQGIGEAIARRLAEEGAAVVVNDVNAANGHKVAREIGEKGGRAAFCEGDVTKLAANEAMVGAATKSFGRMDVFVANAGVTHWNKPMLDVSEDEFDRMFAVNVKGVYQAARACVPVWEAQKSGNMIVIASTAGIRPRPGLVWYNATKGAVIIAVKAMAAEFGPRGIRFNSICPVATETPLLAHFMGGDNADNRARFNATVPLGRLGQPLDHANAAVFLASDESAFITGVDLPVDGGRCI